MLANSEHRQDLAKHCFGAMLMAMQCAKYLGIESEDLVNIIGLTAFLHDIGKCTSFFQNVTLNANCADDYSDLIVKQFYPNRTGQVMYPRHNEVSWVYAMFHAKAKGKDIRFKDVGPQAIYWHHGTFRFTSEILGPSQRNTQIIISEMNAHDPQEWSRVSSEINTIIKSVQFPFDISKYLEDDVDEGPHNISMLFVPDSDTSSLTNAYRLIARSCVIFADHLVSGLSVDDLDSLIKDPASYISLNRQIQYKDFSCPSNYNLERFKVQRDIVANCDKTTLVKAAAGFGKSLIGLMWGAKQTGPIYWVCPRNSVAESVYENLLHENEAFGLGLSIELFLTSKREKTNSPKTKVCGCDIIVTNIDNLLSPMVNYKSEGRLFDVLARNVVMDEFHEFLNDEALFAAFIVYMRARNLVCLNSNTLLLSATPSVMHQFWDGGKRMTTILPNPSNHYPAQHQKRYQMSFEESFVELPAHGTLTMYSSIRNVQKCFEQGKYTDIVHSNYSEEDRKAKTQEVIRAFGRNGDKCGVIVSAPILQAAMDISFTGLYKTLESPESDMQTFGRINRWGEQDSVCQLVMLDPYEDSLTGRKRSRSETAAIKERYNCQLKDLWKSLLMSNLTEPVTLDVLYCLYNRFCSEHNAELIEFITNKYAESLKKLHYFFPRQTKGAKIDKVIAAKTLRNSSSSCFIVVKNRTTNRWCQFVFNVQDIELKDLIDDNRRRIESSKLQTVWKALDTTGKFDYTELKKLFFGKKPRKITVENLKPFARCAETPLPIWSWSYDSTLGLIKS